MNHLKLFLSGLSFIISVSLSLAATQATFYVSPSGTGDFSQANPGPLSGILAKVRTVNTNMTGDIVVNLRGGTYTLSSTWALATADGGTNGHNVIYQAYSGETPVISGGQDISGGWSLSDAGKNIYSKNVGTSVDTRQLYVNGVRAIRARSADGSGWSIINNLNSYSSNSFTCPASVASWSNLTNVEVAVASTWSFSRSKLSSVNGTTATGTNYMDWDCCGAAVVAWVENAYELLDAAGEWYLNRSTGILYYKPRAGENMVNLAMSHHQGDKEDSPSKI